VSDVNRLVRLVSDMAPEDQATRTAARCATHPTSASVAMCRGCARALCLRCAVPVRGEVFGPECLPTVLGPGGATTPTVVAPRPRDVPFVAIGFALMGAVVGSILPWSRFGDPSGLFGGWGIDPQRWSSLATYPAVLGLVLWFVAAAARRQPPRWIVLLLLTASAAIVAGSVLHQVNPPPFTHGWLGPWVTGGFGALGLMASALALRGTLRTERPNRPVP
jgi:hypothetical protein